jgi:cell pole-organizing protein PopZ
MAEASAQSGKSESMEDILQSIKRIIEDDTATDAPAAASEDVLDLTQVVKDDGSVAPIAPLPKPAAVAPPPAGDVMQSIDAMFAPEPAPAMSVAPPAVAPAPKTIPIDEALVSDHAAAAAAAALKPLVDSTHKDFSIPFIPSGQLRNGNTVEDLLLEALRPMLKSWLDEHLPLIVQKIVEKEVKRIVTFRND